MSRFFRSEASSSSSSDDEELSNDDNEDSDIRKDLSQFDNLSIHTDSHASLSRAHSQAGENPRDVLLHALLEERCLNQVRLSEVGRRLGPDSSELHAEARRRYLRLCAGLGPFNLISTGLEDNRYSATRQQYRNGLDMLDRGAVNRSAVSPSLRGLITDVMDHGVTQEVGRGQHAEDREKIDVPDLSNMLTGTISNPDTLPLPSSFDLMQPYHPAPSFHRRTGIGEFLDSRYHRDFEELSMLGRGGFGIVYHVRHRLDKQAYAVKKIPLSPARIRKIQKEGQVELDDFLLELQTLARLEHPNIVRYFGGWIEWVNGASSEHLIASGPTSDRSERWQDITPSKAQNSPQHAIRPVEIESDGRELDILFEDSESAQHRQNSESRSSHTDTENLKLRRFGTRSTVATVTNDTVETIHRSPEASASIVSAADGVQFSQPTLALHLQMSLHPLTLADYLAPRKQTVAGSPKALSHCFHLSPSLDIMLAILDGVEYLHKEGIVHRDIKPANIFLGGSNAPSPMGGAIDLSNCSDCQVAGTINSVSVHVRIGDFGLVTALAQDPAKTSESPALGTELYRPVASISNMSPSLDIYALGIVTFELMWKFETRMERYHTIQELKQGKYPKGFAVQLDRKTALSLEECIEGMLSRGDKAVSVEELKLKLSALRR